MVYCDFSTVLAERFADGETGQAFPLADLDTLELDMRSFLSEGVR